MSEPIVFQVTDEQGIYAAQFEQLRETKDRYDKMIDHQTDVGESK